MDFDDLDDAIEQRLAEGGDMPDTFFEKAPRACCRKSEIVTAMPLCERNAMIPLARDAKASKGREVTLRAFLFYGPGDTVESLSRQVAAAPSWLELVVHEWPGHGLRKEEQPCADLEALVDDAFEGVAPSLEAMKAGGQLEGAPFALLGHSIGAQLLVALARKLEWKLGVVPATVVVLDRAAPQVPLFSEQGEELLKSNPKDLMKAFKHDVWQSGEVGESEGAKALQTWTEDLQRYACCTKELGFHKFACDVTVIRPTNNSQINELAKKGSKYRMTTVRLDGSKESIQIPVQSDVTDVEQVKESLASIFGAKPGDLTVVSEQGEVQKDNDTVGASITVKGISSFKHARHEWQHPIGIIGGGYRGIKTAAVYLKANNSNIVLFDRHDQFGGDAWIDAATKHSKIQTDLAAFNIWFGADFATSGDGGFGRPGYDTWYTRKDLLDSFQRFAEEYGILPYTRFNSDVTQLDIVGDPEDHDRYYSLTVDSTHKPKKDPITVKCSVLYHYGGSYHQNRIVDYPGQDLFDGQIGYGMGAGFTFDDDRMKGANIAILGNGAFAVENVRTCIENGADKVYIVTRRKNLASPRVPCWFAHQGPGPTPGDMILKLFKPMYELTGMGDPFSYWCVVSNKDQTHVTLSQSSRFGIGDATFIFHAYGKLEYVHDTLKRLTKHTLHLESGKKLENVTGIVKALGLIGDFRFDKLHKMTHRVGDMVNGDFRRVINIDATGMHATNFTTFALGIGVANFLRQWQYLHSNPHVYYRAVEEFGLLGMMPVHKGSKTQPDQPIYVTNIQYEMNASIIFGGFFPELGVFQEEDPAYKYSLVHTMHPIDKFLDECTADWDKYQKLFKDQGSTQEYIKYPYNKDMLQGFFDEYSQRVTPITLKGPTEEQKKALLDKSVHTRKALDLASIPALVKKSSLHKSCKGDPYAFALAKSVHADRDRITASSKGSATDFDANQFDMWSEWTSAQCIVEDVAADSSTVLQHPKSWEVIFASLEKVKASVTSR
ncbi:unnamed protein product [Polarella glacialis]|uniref:Thioesterase domain-containing protein n=1 Tax=Polarella glacialis TaxID=89957 RepID=A0A813HHV2_POLGL|nr:unnamed protein product [Polarella glacialis]